MRGEQATVHRYTPTVDAFGNPVLDAHGNATFTYTDVLLDDVVVSPRQGEEPGNNRTAVIVGLTVYLYPADLAKIGDEVGAQDEMTVRGTRYGLMGEPGTWRNPFTGVTRGLQVALERLEG